jgi:hypothetical protein
MTISLSPEQQSALDQARGPLRVIDPRTNTAYVLIPAEAYEDAAEAEEDKKVQQAVRMLAARNAIGRTEEAP